MNDTHEVVVFLDGYLGFHGIEGLRPLRVALAHQVPRIVVRVTTNHCAYKRNGNMLFDLLHI